ncbi:MAG TPA: type III pantothenate kinase [Clostridiales bacterium]|nr:type III pantothenate kinase [Clostridiales bacterium]
MILAVDVGNSNVVLGCIDNGIISDVMRLETNRKKTAHEYAVTIWQILSISGRKKSDFNGAIISSVVPQLTGTLRAAVRIITGCEALIVGAGIKTGLNIGIDDPSQLGADIVSVSVAALSLYKPPLILIDMGTAITITVISANARMLGGAILPGPSIATEALIGRASLLPRIPIGPPKKVIGTNTIDSMQSGTVFGSAASIDGMLDRIEKELGSPATVIATGGMAMKIIPHCYRDIAYDENLLLRGLWLIWQKNLKT